MEKGMEKGIEKATMQNAITMVEDFDIDPQTVAKKLDISVDELKRCLKDR
jgi:hypothetical protein